MHNNRTMNYFFITGSSRGIGLALTKALLENDDHYVVGLSRHNEFKHKRFRHESVDLAQIDELVTLLPKLFDVGESIDRAVLINNAGTLGEIGYMGELDTAKLPVIYYINLVAPALLANEFVKRFRASASSLLILNISSGAGGYPVDGWSGYCATKAGMNMLGEVMALEQEIRGTNIRVFNLAPGVVDTDMQGEIRGADSQYFSQVQKFINLKEDAALASPAAVAKSIIHLLENPDKFKAVQQDVRKF
jgi:benzil reductase ((S)-benzoin forming)